MARNSRILRIQEKQRERRENTYMEVESHDITMHAHWTLFRSSTTSDARNPKFFKDRHYLDKEWGNYLDGLDLKVLMEVGCGAGNTVYPLLSTYPDMFIHACDFSPRAVELVKTHKDFKKDQVNAFVCDLTIDELSKDVSPHSVDIVTMIFVLSAVSPEKMSLVVQNIRNVIKPNGLVLFRDYATGDLAQERFTSKDQKISENFYVRGDGTRAFYFSEEFLTSLFKENGFQVEQVDLHCKQVENRSRELIMNRRWIQGVFRYSDGNSSCLSNPKRILDSEVELDIDISDSIAVDMFGISPTIDEILEINIGDCHFKIKGLSKEYQHTCKSTGLMLWESARLMSEVLSRNPYIVSGKRVLELGCGCTGIASMISARSSSVVVATDGDTKALDLLKENISLNLEQNFLSKLITRKLEWGNGEDLEGVKKLGLNGFDVIIGTDVTYVAEAISPLFATARELIASNDDANIDSRPSLILCHVLRRVDEPSILSVASEYGFRLVDRWPSGDVTSSLSGRIISPWFLNQTYDEDYENTSLNICVCPSYLGLASGGFDSNKIFEDYR
ncbi:hypothetical protein ACHQM5_029657 [Ranunculus cassubicifolius]